ncbi:hypothetical protein DIPPA_35688 [Diplonema papillatum]|nr:hypothetical protein DIPPA_35688 [Diplonema papillatum]
MSRNSRGGPETTKIGAGFGRLTLTEQRRVLEGGQLNGTGPVESVRDALYASYASSLALRGGRGENTPVSPAREPAGAAVAALPAAGTFSVNLHPYAGETWPYSQRRSELAWIW